VRCRPKWGIVGVLIVFSLCKSDGSSRINGVGLGVRAIHQMRSGGNIVYVPAHFNGREGAAAEEGLIFLDMDLSPGYLRSLSERLLMRRPALSRAIEARDGGEMPQLCSEGL
jgi:hypothetical protein